MSSLPLHLQEAGLNMAEPIRRLGLRPSTPDQKLRRIPFRAMADLFPDAPDSCNWNAGISDNNWGMMGNSSVGDCGPAAIGHRKMSRSATKGTLITPTDAEVIQLYEAAGGYVPGKPWTDQGVNNPTMIGLLMKQGWSVGGSIEKIDATATVANGDVVALKKAIFHLGGVMFGIQLSQTCYNNFGPGNVWDADNSRIVGGHDVQGVGFSATGPLIVTWGALTQCTWAWAAKFADDIDILLEIADWTAGGTVPDGLNVAQWATDSQALLGYPPPLPVDPPTPPVVPPVIPPVVPPVVPPSPRKPTLRGIQLAESLALWHEKHPDEVEALLDEAEAHATVQAAMAARREGQLAAKADYFNATVVSSDSPGLAVVKMDNGGDVNARFDVTYCTTAAIAGQRCLVNTIYDIVQFAPENQTH
jgi:hypothetical protein